MFYGQSSSPSPLYSINRCCCIASSSSKSPHNSQFVESVVQHLNVQIDVVQTPDLFQVRTGNAPPQKHALYCIFTVHVSNTRRSVNPIRDSGIRFPFSRDFTFIETETLWNSFATRSNEPKKNKYKRKQVLFSNHNIIAFLLLTSSCSPARPHFVLNKGLCYQLQSRVASRLCLGPSGTEGAINKVRW